MGTTLTEVLTQTGTTPSTKPANAFQLDREATLTTTRATLATLGAAMAADSRFLSKTKASEVDLKAEGSTQLSEILDNDEFTIRMKAPPEAPDGFYEVKRKYDNSERADESSEMYQLNPADKLAAVREALDDFMKPGYQFLVGKSPLGKAAEAKTTLAAIATKTGDQSEFAILMKGERPASEVDGAYEVTRKYDNPEQDDESSRGFLLNPTNTLAAVRTKLELKDFMEPGYQFLLGKSPLDKAAEAKTTLAAIATKTGEQSGFAILMTGELLQQD